MERSRETSNLYRICRRLLDKNRANSLDYAFRNQARTLTSSLAAVKTISSRPQENIFTETELDLWPFLQLKSGAG
jgi:hypothetical protein